MWSRFGKSNSVLPPKHASVFFVAAALSLRCHRLGGLGGRGLGRQALRCSTDSRRDRSKSLCGKWPAPSSRRTRTAASSHGLSSGDRGCGVRDPARSDRTRHRHRQSSDGVAKRGSGCSRRWATGATSTKGGTRQERAGRVPRRCADRQRWADVVEDLRRKCSRITISTWSRRSWTLTLKPVLR